MKSGRWRPYCVDRSWTVAMRKRLREGRPLAGGEWPEIPPRFVYDAVASIPDVNEHVDLDIWIVSQRLRQFLEAVDPGCAEFLPVDVDGPAREILHRRYWCVNWLRCFDCQPDKGRPEIEPGDVPDSAGIFVVAPHVWWLGGEVLVRQRVKRAMAREKFVGLRFERVRPVGPPTTLVRRKRVRDGKVELIERRMVPSDPQFDVDAYFADGWGANDETHVPGSTAFLEYVTMHSAMGRLEERVVARFLREGGDPNVGTTPNTSALLVVISPKTPSLVKLLQEYGADWNVANSLNGLTPLMSAAAEGNAEVVELLLRFGADRNACDFGGFSALDHVLDQLDRSDHEPADRDVLLAVASVLSP